MKHKMLFHNATDLMGHHENQGVLGIGIVDQRFHFECSEKYIHKIRYRLFGCDSQYDNVICNEQRIQISLNQKIRYVSFLGMNECGVYYDQIQFITEQNETIIKPILFYQFSENLDSLYQCDMSKDCQVALCAKTNGFYKAKYYYNKILVNENIKEIILPENAEMHIAAITAIV